MLNLRRNKKGVTPYKIQVEFTSNLQDYYRQQREAERRTYEAANIEFTSDIPAEDVSFESDLPKGTDILEELYRKFIVSAVDRLSEFNELSIMVEVPTPTIAVVKQTYNDIINTLQNFGVIEYRAQIFNYGGKGRWEDVTEMIISEQFTDTLPANLPEGIAARLNLRKNAQLVDSQGRPISSEDFPAEEPAVEKDTVTWEDLKQRREPLEKDITNVPGLPVHLQKHRPLTGWERFFNWVANMAQAWPTKAFRLTITKYGLNLKLRKTADYTYSGYVLMQVLKGIDQSGGIITQESSNYSASGTEAVVVVDTSKFHPEGIGEAQKYHIKIEPIGVYQKDTMWGEEGPPEGMANLPFASRLNLRKKYAGTYLTDKGKGALEHVQHAGTSMEHLYLYTVLELVEDNPIITLSEVLHDIAAYGEFPEEEVEDVRAAWDRAVNENYITEAWDLPANMPTEGIIASKLNLRKKFAEEPIKEPFSSLLPEIKEIYELEYKMSQSTNSRHVKFYQYELDRMLTQTLTKIAKIIIDWYQTHDGQNPYEAVYISTENVDVDDADLMTMINTYNNLKTVYHEIVTTLDQDDTNSKLVAFHHALQVQHSTGPFTAYMVDDVKTEIPELDKLSEGVDIPQWEVDLRKENASTRQLTLHKLSKLNLHKKYADSAWKQFAETASPEELHKYIEEKIINPGEGLQAIPVSLLAYIAVRRSDILPETLQLLWDKRNNIYRGHGLHTSTLKLIEKHPNLPEDVQISIEEIARITEEQRKIDTEDARAQIEESTARYKKMEEDAIKKYHLDRPERLPLPPEEFDLPLNMPTEGIASKLNLRK